MSEFAEGTVEEKQSFWSNLPDVKGYMDQKLPTMDKSLDTYFDKNMEAIIEEWGLLLENDLIDLERRVNTVTAEINQLYNQKDVLNDRVTKLDATISKLEGR
jgi:septal ring factor EnvC (AmiA/AmiB activator)